MKNVWTEKDDKFLAEFGPVLGWEFIGTHDLQRTASETLRRVRWLRKNRPGFIEQWERHCGKGEK